MCLYFYHLPTRKALHLLWHTYITLSFLCEFFHTGLLAFALYCLVGRLPHQCLKERPRLFFGHSSPLTPERGVLFPPSYYQGILPAPKSIPGCSNFSFSVFPTISTLHGWADLCHAHVGFAWALNGWWLGDMTRMSPCHCYHCMSVGWLRILLTISPRLKHPPSDFRLFSNGHFCSLLSFSLMTCALGWCCACCTLAI